MDLSVSNLSIYGMIFTVIVCFAAPIVLLALGRANWNGKIKDFGIGIVLFLVVIFFLQSFFDSFVYSLVGGILQNSTLVNAIYVAFSTVLFEETSRYLLMKKWDAQNWDAGRAYMMGSGFAAIRSILMFGIFNVSYIATAKAMNNGTISETLELLGAEEKESYLISLKYLAEHPAHEFFIQGVEQLVLILVTVALSILMYQGVSKNNKVVIVESYGIHFVMILFATVAGAYLGIVAEFVVMALAAVSAWVLVIQNKKQMDFE